MSIAFCIGGGKIGRTGVQSLLDEGAKVLLVDPDENCLARSLCHLSVEDPDSIIDCEEGQALYLKRDGIEVLIEVFRRWVPDQIIPAVKGHLAARLAMAWANETHHSIHPSGNLLLKITDMLPIDSVQFMDNAQGVLITSHMTTGSICKVGCGQPLTCPVTNKRSMPMYQLIDQALTNIIEKYSILVTQGANIGVLDGQDVKSMLNIIDNLEDGATFSVTTSCRCHAIVNLFRYYRC
ncbi:MAG: NAD(P)-dependent oxidoreductase [Euryarchaeota archaeon]|nr:NAD(P)-dependent oxidoreductase [Euryarchaeota archaeon]